MLRCRIAGVGREGCARKAGGAATFAGERAVSQADWPYVARSEVDPRDRVAFAKRAGASEVFAAAL